MSSPFGSTAPAIGAALVYAGAALLWTAVGPSLPGGRWLAVHLFTLGVVTNVVLVFCEHFGRTLTRTAAHPIRWQTPMVNLGILMTLVARSYGSRWVTTAGATVVTAVVIVSWRRLRRMRMGALGARFSWIVQMYERAHAAFVLGALLGLLMGIGALRGGWYAPARTAHLHVNILGWAGLTLLATLVFFGPTIVRTRIVAGADARAAVALRRGSTALAVAIVLLLGSGAGAPTATMLRVAAAVAMAGFAWSVTVVCLPVAAAARAAKPSAARWPLIAVSWWFPALVWADVVLIGTGAWQWLDPLGLAMILGVLVQIIAAVLGYLAPMLRTRSSEGRGRLLSRMEAGASARAGAFNVGTIAVVTAAVAGGAAGAVLARMGWVLVATSLVWLIAAAGSPLPRDVR